MPTTDAKTDAMVHEEFQRFDVSKRTHDEARELVIRASKRQDVLQREIKRMQLELRTLETRMDVVNAFVAHTSPVRTESGTRIGKNADYTDGG